MYVGSTTRTLRERLSQHKADYRQFLAGKYHYVKSFDLVKYTDCHIHLLHESLFDTKADMYRLEGQYMLSTQNCINKAIAGRTAQERYDLNRDHILETQRQYNASHRDTIRQRWAHKFACPTCHGQFSLSSKAKHERTAKHMQALGSIQDT